MIFIVSIKNEMLKFYFLADNTDKTQFEYHVFNISTFIVIWNQNKTQQKYNFKWSVAGIHEDILILHVNKWEIKGIDKQIILILTLNEPKCYCRDRYTSWNQQQFCTKYSIGTQPLGVISPFQHLSLCQHKLQSLISTAEFLD